MKSLLGVVVLLMAGSVYGQAKLKLSGVVAPKPYHFHRHAKGHPTHIVPQPESGYKIYVAPKPQNSSGKVNRQIASFSESVAVTSEPQSWQAISSVTELKENYLIRVQAP